jgi:hypothetical protein
VRVPAHGELLVDQQLPLHVLGPPGLPACRAGPPKGGGAQSGGGGGGGWRVPTATADQEAARPGATAAPGCSRWCLKHAVAAGGEAAAGEGSRVLRARARGGALDHTARRRSPPAAPAGCRGRTSLDELDGYQLVGQAVAGKLHLAAAARRGTCWLPCMLIGLQAGGWRSAAAAAAALPPQAPAPGCCWPPTAWPHHAVRAPTNRADPLPARVSQQGLHGAAAVGSGNGQVPAIA